MLNLARKLNKTLISDILQYDFRNLNYFLDTQTEPMEKQLDGQTDVEFEIVI